MKNIKLIDVLPTLFGVIGAASFVVALAVPHTSALTEARLPQTAIGCAAASLITALISVVNAWQKKRISWVHILNLIWVLPAGALVVWLALLILGFWLHPFTF